MSTKIIVFNPLSPDDVQIAEKQLDELTNQDWEIVSTISGSSATENKDYIVLILRKTSFVPVLPRIETPSGERERPARSIGFIC